MQNTSLEERHCLVVVYQGFFQGKCWATVLCLFCKSHIKQNTWKLGPAFYGIKSAKGLRNLDRIGDLQNNNKQVNIRARIWIWEILISGLTWSSPHNLYWIHHSFMVNSHNIKRKENLENNSMYFLIGFTYRYRDVFNLLMQI